MGWRGTIRSIVAASRRIERENERQQKAAQREALRQARQYERDLKAWNKEQALQAARNEVEENEAIFQRLVSIHKHCGEVCDWKAIQESLPPIAPESCSTYEAAAQNALDNFKPSFLDKALHKVDDKRSALEQQLLYAQKRDEEVYQQLYAEYLKAYEEWAEQIKLATAILNGDLGAYNDAITELNPFGDITDFGSSVSFRLEHPLLIEIALKVNGEEAVPKDTKKLLQSGKVSAKPLSKRQLEEIYQDYVCACVLRIVREVLALLPVEHVVVNALADILNTQTGQLEESTILSVYVPRATTERLNWQKIDPSDAFNNFKHVSGFQRGEGFHAVERLEVSTNFSAPTLIGSGG
jgi:hypothetical protein